MLFNMALKRRAQVLFSVLEPRKAVIGHMEGTHVLDKHYFGMNDTAVSHKFYVNESTIYIKMSLSRNTHRARLHVNQFMKMYLEACISRILFSSRSSSSVFTNQCLQLFYRT